MSWSGTWRPPLSGITIRPRPLQERIPLWSGSTSNLELCARLGLPCMWVATVYPFEQLAPLADRYRQAWVDAGRSLDTFELGIGVHCHVGRTSQEARARFFPHFAHYFECSDMRRATWSRRAAAGCDVSLFDTVPFCGSVRRSPSASPRRGGQLLTRIGLVVDLGGMERSGARPDRPARRRRAAGAGLRRPAMTARSVPTPGAALPRSSTARLRRARLGASLDGIAAAGVGAPALYRQFADRRCAASSRPARRPPAAVQPRWTSPPWRACRLRDHGVPCRSTTAGSPI